MKLSKLINPVFKNFQMLVDFIVKEKAEFLYVVLNYYGISITFIDGILFL